MPRSIAHASKRGPAWLDAVARATSANANSKPPRCGARKLSSVNGRICGMVGSNAICGSGCTGSRASIFLTRSASSLGMPANGSPASRLLCVEV